MAKNLILTNRQVAALNRANDQYNLEVAAMPRYPVVDFETLVGMPQALVGNGPSGLVAKDSMLHKLGWERHTLVDLPPGFDLGKLGIDLGATLRQFQGGRGKNRHDKRRQGKGKGKGDGDRTLMNPQIVHSLIKKAIDASGLKPVGMSGPIVRAVHNFEFLTKAKARWFIDALCEIIQLAHVWSCAEITEDGLKEIAERTGYLYVVSVENTRGQAVGLLIHPRLKKLGTWTIDDVANVQGVADLRPIIGEDLEDTNPDCPPDEKHFWEASGHPKSMRGGVEASGKVRRVQNQKTAVGLKGRGAGALGMDSNSMLGTPQGDWETSPLTEEAGLLLVGPDDHRQTQTMGSRLDGLFARDLGHVLEIMAQLNWFEDPALGRALTDHGALVVKPK
jgi:hypothetical protein